MIATFYMVALLAQAEKPSIGAEMIVFNARITTQNLSQPAASAVAIKNGRIYAVGSDAEILALKGNSTKIIDADGRRLIPGLNDSHIHILNEANYNYNIRWDGVPTLKRALEMLSEQAKRTPEGQWVKAIGGWSPYQFKENRLPTMEELNKAVPNRALIVQYTYNTALLNEMAMKEMGVGTSKFPMLPGTIFEKDKQGRYTGIMHAYTFTFATMETLVPYPSFEEQVNSIIYVVNDLNSFGITTAIEGGGRSYPESHAPLRALIKDNRLNIRYPFLDVQFRDDAVPRVLIDAEIDAITRIAPISPGENLHPTMAHGYEYTGTGELLKMELHDHENFDRPAVIINQDSIRHFTEEYIRKLVIKRIPFRMHISYNENITPFLDALENVNRQTPLDGLRWAIEHAETISPENIERVKKLGGGIALDDKMALHGDGFIKTYSREKALETPRLRYLFDSGIPLAMTTDGFRASSYNPWTGIAWTVTGKSVSGSEILATNNRLTRQEALKLYTLGAAWFEYNEKEKGKIAPGNLADFALLSADYFTIPENEIKNITSVLTVVDGRVVFGTGKYSSLAPKLPEVIPAWAPRKYFGGHYSAE
ncbi:MAG: amidohydrolase [Chitinophagaceae bacterium]|nr:amidohydrolase [Chitinophagaceae bacterium]